MTLWSVSAVTECKTLETNFSGAEQVLVKKSCYREYFYNNVPDADALMNPTKGLKDEESSVFNKILKACNQKEVIHKNLKEKIECIQIGRIKQFKSGKDFP